MKDIPAAKIKMMEASLRCLACGLISLLPVIGLPFVIAALWYSGVASRRERQFWNPARPQRLTGLACAVVVGLFWGGVAVIWASNAYVSG